MHFLLALMVVLLNVSSQRFEGNILAKIFERMFESNEKVKLKNYVITIKNNEQHRNKSRKIIKKDLMDE